jgi:Tol biopolymer transport system component
VGAIFLLFPTVIKNAAVSDISPDSSQRLVGINKPGDTSFWIQPLPSGSPRKIGDLEAGWGAWSPDGKWLLYSTGSDLYICDADGNQKRKLASFKLGFPFWTYFSPDGHRIRFTLDNRRNSTYSLWEVRTDGSDLHHLLAGWRNPPDECCGRWTPDGRYYVFESYLRRSDKCASFDRKATVGSFGLMA